MEKQSSLIELFDKLADEHKYLIGREIHRAKIQEATGRPVTRSGTAWRVWLDSEVCDHIAEWYKENG